MEMNTYGGDYFAEVSATFHKFSDTFAFTGKYHSNFYYQNNFIYRYELWGSVWLYTLF